MRRYLVVVAAALVLAACGGNVVVDAPIGSGGGGVGGTGGTGGFTTGLNPSQLCNASCQLANAECGTNVAECFMTCSASTMNFTQACIDAVALMLACLAADPDHKTTCDATGLGITIVPGPVLCQAELLATGDACSTSL